MTGGTQKVKVLQVWSWQQAILDAKIDSQVKFVLLALATYMNQHGGSCFPTIPTLAEKTGLSERTIIRKIAIAEEKGFIKKKKHGYGGQNWANNEYIAVFPPSEVYENGSDTESPPLKEGHDTESSPLEEGSDTESPKVVTQSHPNYPYNYPYIPPLTPPEKSGGEDVDDDFKKFWEVYPKQDGWPAAKEEYLKLRKDGVEASLLQAAVERYAEHIRSRKVEARYVVKGHNWLKRGKWKEHVPAEAPPPPAEPSDPVFCKVKQRFVNAYGLDAWNSWLAKAEIAGRTQGSVELAVPMKFVKKWIDTNYRNFLLKAWQEEDPTVTNITLQVGGDTHGIHHHGVH